MHAPGVVPGRARRWSAGHRRVDRAPLAPRLYALWTRTVSGRPGHAVLVLIAWSRRSLPSTLRAVAAPAEANPASGGSRGSTLQSPEPDGMHLLVACFQPEPVERVRSQAEEIRCLADSGEDR